MSTDHAVAVPHQEEIRVFVNTAGGVSIAQDDETSHTGESIVAVRPENISALIAALRVAKKEALGKAAG